MRKVTILALHLAYGGVEKAVCEFANLMAERYDVEILSVYDMPNAPAYPIDSRVKITYLLKDIPNREEWKEALHARNIPSLLKESVRAAAILVQKRTSVIRAVRNIPSGVVVAMRDEHAVLLSRYGQAGVMKIAQLHQDHAYEKKLVRHFQHDYGGIDVFTLLSPKMEQEVQELMQGNKHTRVLYVPNFMETIPPEADPRNRDRTVLSVGRLHPVKGYDRLIRLFAKIHEQFPAWKLVIVGSGEEQGRLEKCISEFALEGCVTLAGRYSAPEVQQAMTKAAVFAMSSYSEGFPFVLLEAMSCSLPIVAFDTRGGLNMLVHDGENGRLVGQEEDFCEALACLMRDDALREKMAGSSRALSLAFSREAVGKIWFDLIEEHFQHERE